MAGALQCILPPFARPSPSVCLSVCDKSERCEDGERWAYGYYEEPIGRHHQATHRVQLLQPPPFYKLGAYNPESKVAI